MKAISEEDVLKRFYVDADGCHIFTGIIHSRGYGVVSQKSKTYSAHRFFYEKHKGSIPDGMYVRHLCHKKSCVNPVHLEIGTQAQNMEDMVRANRQAKGYVLSKGKEGERNPASKRTAASVLEIRRKRAEGALLRELAEEYGVCESVISVAARGLKWKSVG